MSPSTSGTNGSPGSHCGKLSTSVAKSSPQNSSFRLRNFASSLSTTQTLEQTNFRRISRSIVRRKAGRKPMGTRVSAMISSLIF